MTATLRIPLAEIFRSEITAARRLGYRVQINPQPGTAIVRLVPCTQRTIALARANDAKAIEAAVPYDDPRDRNDATRAALAAVMEHAKDAAA